MITPANLPFFQFFSATKTPLAGGKLHSYLAGTDTPVATYTDYTGSTEHSNPITLDSLGTANVWVDSGVAYKFVLKNSAGSTLRTWDGINNYAQTYTDSDEIQGEGASTDLTTEVQAKLTALGAAGGGTLVLHGIVYCASDITLPDHVHLVGVTPSIGSQRFSGFIPSAIGNALYLSNSATINVGAGSTIKDLMIVNANLAAAAPFANVGAATSAINAFAGTAIEGFQKEDVFLSGLRILGFAQAVRMDYCNRTKIEWLDIDCTAGIWISNTFDIDRFQCVHCWPFISYFYSFIYSIVNRSGSAFKITGEFDGSSIDRCFSYAYAVGFDIQCPQNVTITNCHSDSYGTAAVNPGQIGYKFSADVSRASMIGCGSSANDIGVSIDGSSAEINVDLCQFWGNKTHAKVLGGLNTTFTGSHFTYLNRTWTGGKHLHIDGAGIVYIHGCKFGGDGRSNDSVYVENQTALVLIKSNNFIQVKTGIEFTSTTGCTTVISENFLDLTDTGILISSTQTNNLSNIYGNGSVPGMAPDEMRFSPGGYADSWRTLGSSGGNIHGNYLVSGTTTSPAVPGRNKSIGSYKFLGWTGTEYKEAARIRGVTSGTFDFATGNSPGFLVFSTTPNGADEVVDRHTINEEGHFLPLTDNAYVLGGASYKWTAVYAANGTIQTSNDADKTDIQETPLGLNFIEKLTPVSCKFKVGGREPDENDKTKMVERPGKRTHHLLLASNVKKAADEFGIDFAGWGLADKDDPNSDQWLNYSQFIAPLISAVKELSSRVKSLEGKK